MQAEKMDLGVKELFQQAVDTWGSAMKAGVQFQDDVAHWWQKALGQAGSVQEWQKKSCALIAEAIPTAQKNTEEALKLVDQNYRAGLELIKKAMDSGRSENFDQMQSKTQEVLQASVSAMRQNAQAMAQANLRAMESWADFVRRNVNGQNAAATEAVRTMAAVST